MDREQENSLLTGLGLGLGLAGAGAAGFGARSLLKNRAARQRKAAAQSPSGAGGVDMVDLSGMQLPERAKPTRAQAYENAARRPVTDFEFQQYRPSGGSTDPGTVTDVVTGEIYRRGGDDAYYQQNRNLQTTQRVDRGDMPLSTPRSAATPLLPGRAPTTGGIDLVDLPPARPDRAQSLVDEYIANAERENRRVDKVKRDIDTLREGKAMGIIDELRNEPRTLVEVQETTEPRVIQNSIESVDTAQDQMAGRVARTVQRDIDGDLAAFDTVQDSLEQRGAFPVETERAARIARNRAKDKARVSDYMSDVLESVISEAEFTSETIPSDLLKLAERAGTGNIDVQDVNIFKNWAGTEFKNDPAVLSEINETLSSNIFSSETSTKQRGATPVEAARAAANVIEGEPVYTQTDRLVNEGRSYLRARDTALTRSQEIDLDFDNQYET